MYALCVQVHRDETTGNILNLVMVQADEGTMLKVNLPVEFKGEAACPGLKKGTASFISFFDNISWYARHISLDGMRIQKCSFAILKHILRIDVLHCQYMAMACVKKY